MEKEKKIKIVESIMLVAHIIGGLGVMLYFGNYKEADIPGIVQLSVILIMFAFLVLTALFAFLRYNAFFGIPFFIMFLITLYGFIFG